MSTLKFGFCDAIINPDPRITLAGYKHRFEVGSGNSGILDNLYARVLSLKDEENELLLITLDLCMMRVETSDSIRKTISEKFDIPEKNIMLSLSHTHSGPVTFLPDSKEKGEYDRINELEKDIHKYIENLKNVILTIVSEARSRKHKCKISTVTLRMNLGYNRRFHMKDKDGNKSVKMHFNLWRNADDVFMNSINNDIDEEIPVLMIERIWDKGEDDYLMPYGQNKIILFSVPYHPVVLGELNRYISADYPGAAIETIEKELGSGTKAMFLLGACGDVNVVPACQENPAAVEIVGKAIGYGIIAALAKREYLRVDNICALQEYCKFGDIQVETQVFKLGESAIAAISAECFSELGLAIRNISGYKQILVATNSNGTTGYLPSKHAFEEGGYEIKIAYNIGYPDTALEVVIGKILNLLS